VGRAGGILFEDKKWEGVRDEHIGGKVRGKKKARATKVTGKKKKGPKERWSDFFEEENEVRKGENLGGG